MNRETYSLIEDYMLSCMQDSAHDKEHIYRVLYNALRIAKKERNVDYKVGISFIVIAAVTAVIGANIAHFIDVRLLKKLFAIYLLLIGGFMLFKKKEDRINTVRTNRNEEA